MDPERRRHLDQMGPGDSYTSLLEVTLAHCLKFDYKGRVKSWELMTGVRRAEKILFSTPAEGLKCRLLPEWVYN